MAQAPFIGCAQSAQNYANIIPQQQNDCNCGSKLSKHTKKHLRKAQMFTKKVLTFPFLFGKIKHL